MPSATYVDEKDFKDWLKNKSIECVLFNEQSWYQPILLCKKMGIKTGAYIDYYTEKSLELFSLYDFLICNTQRHYAAFSWHEQCYYVPWGTDIELFQPRENDKKDDKLAFFHSAGMNPFRKGTDFLLKAFYELNKKYDKIKLIIHTQKDITIYFPELKDIIQELIKTGSMEIIHKTVSAPGLYHLGDVYVYPSRIEGIGLSIAEAIACGLPVVTSDNKPMSEFVKSPSQVVEIKKLYCRKDGYYWPVCEVELKSLIEKMESFITNKENLEQYKAESRAYAVKKLDWRKNQKQVNKIFTDAEILEYNKEIETKINKYDNRKYIGITKLPMLYSFLYKMYYRLRK
jgi:glycosyltransferase involved in cell wall biosynthesis